MGNNVTRCFNPKDGGIEALNPNISTLSKRDKTQQSINGIVNMTNPSPSALNEHGIVGTIFNQTKNVENHPD